MPMNALNRRIGRRFPNPSLHRLLRRGVAAVQKLRAFAEILEDDLHIECTTFRKEGPYPDARHPAEVEFTSDPLEDLKRRDLTVNAIAFDPRQGILLDPHGGVLDLERRVLRAVGIAAERFR